MEVDIRGRVGEVTAADGVPGQPRLTRELLQAVADARGHFAEAVTRGRVFTAALAVGQAPGTGLGLTAPLAIWNPPNSGRNLEILETTFAWASGTLGAGKLWHVLHAFNAATPGGTEQAPVNLYGAAARGSGRAFAAATGLGTQSGVRIWATVTALAADVGTSGVLRELVDGLLVVPPGGAYSMQEVGAAGTTPLVFCSVTWQEVPG